MGPIFWGRDSFSQKRTRIEARRDRERGVEISGRGRQPPVHQLGEPFEIPSGVWSGASAEVEFGAFSPKNLASDD